MGQRLNIEIWNKGKCLANAYYHWSAYTDSSCELVLKLLDTATGIGYPENNREAIKLLEHTGAGLTEEERYEMQQRGYDIEEFRPCIDRNNGLIAVSDGGIKRTRFWEEYRVVIDFESQTVNFGVLNALDNDVGLQIELDDWGYDVDALMDAPTLDVEIDDIPFSDFKAFYDTVHSNDVLFSKDGRNVLLTIG